jgi:hypothetical protein
MQRLDGALEYRSKAEVEADPGLGQEPAGQAGLGDALLGEIDVMPAGKAVVAVPRALPMAQKNKLGHSVLLEESGRRGGGPRDSTRPRSPRGTA